MIQTKAYLLQIISQNNTESNKSIIKKYHFFEITAPRKFKPFLHFLRTFYNQPNPFLTTCNDNSP